MIMSQINGPVTCAQDWLKMDFVRLIGPNIYRGQLGRLRILVKYRATVAKVGTNFADIKISNIIIRNYI